MFEEDDHDEDADDDDDGCIHTHLGSGWRGGGRGDDDDIVMQTPRTISREAVLLCIYSAFVMSDHLT